MALIRCAECQREVSDRAAACPGCGAPVQNASSSQAAPASSVRYDRKSDTCRGTVVSVVRLAMRAVESLGWKLDQVNESVGLVTFQTGISWGSWSGISCSLTIEELAPNSIRVTGAGKENLRGGQLIALNLGGEAQGKARKAIEKMQALAS